MKGEVMVRKLSPVSCLLSLVLAVPAMADASFTHVAADASAVPEASRFVADAFAKRVADRSRSKETNGVFKVTFRLDPSLGGENAKVSVSDGGAEIVGSRVRSLWYGAGKLLAALDYRADSFSAKPQVLEVKPVKPVRIAYWARHFHNWYHEATAKELNEYAEDMMLMGMNGFKYQYAFPVINRAGTSKGEIAAYERVSKAVYDHCRAMDADFVAGGGGNQASDDTPEKFRGEPITEWYRGNGGFNVCPAKPGALDYLLNWREGILGGQLKDSAVGYWIHWPYDEGGCACATCRPWGGRGFVSLCERFAKLNKAHSPAAKTVLATWTFQPEEYELLWNYLAKPESRWIDMLMIDAHGDFPKYPLEHKLPRDIPVVTFPEISMWGRYPWGGYGAIAMPQHFEDLFRQCEKLVSGFMFYSEGLSEDLNKAVVTGLYVDPSARWQGIVRDYARYHFPGVDPEKFVRFAELLESSHCVPGNCWKLNSFVQPEAELDAYEAKAKAVAAMARELDGEILPRLKNSWRWRLLMLRAEVDEIMSAARDYFAPALAKPYAEIRRIYRSAGEEVFYPNGYNHVSVTPYWPTVRLRGRPGETLRFRMVYVNHKDHAVTVDPTFGREIEGLKLRGGHLRLNGEVAWGEKVTLEPGKSDVLVGEIAMDETVWLGNLRLKFADHLVGVTVTK